MEAIVAREPAVRVGLRARFTMRAVVLVLLLTLTACGHHQEDAGPTATRPQPEVHHDTEVLARTFPALGTPVSASWIRWDNSGGQSAPSAKPGDESPAPRTGAVWIDAVVQVTPETMNALVTQHQSDVSDQHPAVQKALEADVPPGPFRTGVELNLAFSQGRASTRVFLDPPRNTVVLQSLDMG